MKIGRKRTLESIKQRTNRAVDKSPSQKTMQVWGTGAGKHLLRGVEYTVGLEDGKTLIARGHAVASKAEVPTLKAEPAKAKEAKAE